MTNGAETLFDAYLGWLKKARFYKHLSIFSTIVIVILAIIYTPKTIPFWKFETSDVVTLLTSLILVSLFIERANEVILIAWRGKGQQTILTKISLEKQKLASEGKNLANAYSSVLASAKSDLEQYSAETRSIALLTALGFGIMASAIGIRAIYPLVDPSVLDQVNSVHHAVFTAIDVFITGALLGGGANGIHKILDLFLSFVDKSRERIKERGTVG